MGRGSLPDFMRKSSMVPFGPKLYWMHFSCFYPLLIQKALWGEAMNGSSFTLVPKNSSSSELSRWYNKSLWLCDLKIFRARSWPFLLAYQTSAVAPEPIFLMILLRLLVSYCCFGESAAFYLGIVIVLFKM